MKKVELSNLNIEKLYRMREIEGKEAMLYRRGYKLIKVYNVYIDREHRMNALQTISGLRIKNVVVPNAIISDCVSKKNAAGCTMRYYPKAKNLDKFFTSYNREDDMDIYLELVRKASQTLQDIHSLGITCGDVSFSNIMYLPNLNPLFCDFDGISIENRGPESGVLYFYRTAHNLSKSLNSTSDKISMYLSFLNSIFLKTYNEIDEFDYDKMAEKHTFLKHSKSVFSSIMGADGYFCDIPYLHEMIPSKIKIKEKK